MSKTYRNRPREEAALREVRYERRILQPEAITPEWAVKVMERHIQLWIYRQVASGLFCDQERDEYEAMLNRAVCRACACYDPRRRNERGEGSSAVHYIRKAVDHEMNKIANGILGLRRKFPSVPIVNDPPEDAAAMGCISEEDVRLSDQCRSVRELVFKMDVRTLMRRLPAACVAYLKCRLAGYTKEEASDMMGISVYRIRQDILPKLREEAVRCGFEPRSMVEGERPWRKKNEKLSHDFPPERI